MNGTNRIAGTMSLALGVFVTMASSCGQEAAPAAEVPRPNIVLEPSALDFGKLYEPDSYTQQVTIRNTGDAELVLRTLASTCGCTVPRIGDSRLVQTKGTAIDVRIAPGESVIMDVTLNSFGKLDTVEQQVTITSNDPDTPSAIVEVTAFVEPIVRITPWPLNFGDVQKGATVTRTIAVTTKEPTFQLRRVSFDGDRRFKAKLLGLERVIRDGEEVTRAMVEITMSGARTPGDILVNATIRTNYSVRRRLTLRIHATVLGDLEAPKILQFGALEPGSTIEHSFTMKSRSGEPFKILGVRHAGENGASVEFTAAPNDTDRPTSYDVTIRMPDAPQNGAMRGTLIITTDVPDEESLEMKYQGFVRVASSGG